jgi:hypothetical protein
MAGMSFARHSTATLASSMAVSKKPTVLAESGVGLWLLKAVDSQFLALRLAMGNAMPSPSVPQRRLEDRIRNLCDRLKQEKDPLWSDVIIELQAAINEHNLRAANLASTAIVARRPDLIVERRVGTPQPPE